MSEREPNRIGAEVEQLPAHQDLAEDPSFDLRKGLVVLLIFVTIVALITIICLWIARP